jgi:uncharacterized damage-inducible protein DinB
MASITQLLIAELDRELPGTRRTLERVPEGRNDWKPHEKSMRLGYLAGLVATMPSWIVSIVEEPHLDLEAAGRYQAGALDSTAALLEEFDRAAAEARASLERTTDQHLLTTSWKLLMQGRTLSDDLRYVAIRDGALNHLYHHRAQLTIYLRLNGRAVPALYGPSADEPAFG